jgi:predicted DsbA family dithiol-disulfide isomerase
LIRWRAFPLHPETPEQGVSLEQLFTGRSIDTEEIRHRLTRTAKDLGLPFQGVDTLYNSRLAQELGLWAESKSKGDEFHTAVFRGYFADGRNISEIPVLAELASSVGLPADEAAEVLKTRSFKAAVDADWAVSRYRSITAVPTMMLNQHCVVGAQPYEALQELMAANGVKKRN